MNKTVLAILAFVVLGGARVGRRSRLLEHRAATPAGDGPFDVTARHQ